MNEKKVGFIEKIGLMLFSMGGNVVYIFRNGYYLIFLTNVLEIPIATAGTILTLGLIWDAVNDPLIGLFCANIKFKSGEIARPWLLISALPWAITTILLFCDFKTNQTITVILCIIFYFLYEIASTFRGIPYSLTSTLASDNEDDRKSMNAFKSLGAGLGSGIGSVAVTSIVKMFGGLKGSNAIISPDDAPALLKTAIMMGVLCVVGCLIHYFTTKERIKPIEENDEKLGLVESYKMLFKCRSWVMNLIFGLCYNVSTTLLLSTASYYAAYVLGSSSKSTVISAIYLLAMLIFSALAPAIDKKLGRRNTLIFGVAIQIVGKIPYLINPTSQICVWINAFTLGVGATINFVITGAIGAKVCDIIELQNGRRMDTMSSGGSSFISKIASAGVTKLMTAILAAAGFNQALGANQSATTVSAICNLMGIIPLIVNIVNLVFVFFFDADKEYEEAKENYEAQKA